MNHFMDSGFCKAAPGKASRDVNKYMITAGDTKLSVVVLFMVSKNGNIVTICHK